MHTPKTTKNDQIFRKVRGILNKLTPEKFQKLSDDLLQTELDSDVILKGVILLIFEKALDEPKYSSMYAQLCKRLTEEAPNFEPPNAPCTFRVLLLNKCKSEFDNRSHASDDTILSSEDEERKQGAKRKMLGNIKFIGELGKLDILAEGILHRCVQELLGTNRYKPMAEDLECLCQIMRTCGRILDTDKGSNLMEQYFNRMQIFAKNQDLPSRIRFMLQDVIELRRDKWVPRKATNTEGPVPMNQLCEEENGRNMFGNSSDRRQNFNQELFRLTLKTRGGFEEMLSGTLAPLHTSGPMHPYDKFNSYNGGYQSNYRQQSRQNHHQSGNQQQFYQQNRYNNQHNIYNSHNMSNTANKDLAPRFKKMMNHQPAATNLDEISLRPPSNSMVFKPMQTKPQISMQPVNNHMPTPHSVKENVVVIKPAPIDKNKGNKKEKGPSKEEILKKVGALTEELLKERSVESALSAWREHKVPERLVSEALVTVLAATLDKTEADRQLALSLVATLRKENLASNTQVVDCLRNLVNSMEEKEAVVPKIHSHVGELLADAVKQSLVSLNDVAEMTEGGSHHPLFLLMLQTLHQNLGKQELTQLFNQSKVNLLSTLPEADRSKDRLSELLDDRGLGFLCLLLRIQAELWKRAGPITQRSVDRNHALLPSAR